MQASNFQTKSVSRDFLRRTSHKVLLFTFFCFLCLLSTAQNKPLLVDLQTVTNLKSESSPDIILLNLWATWCKPCIQELPYFEQIGEKYNEQGVRVILLSVDRPADLETRVTTFQQQQKLKSEVWLLDEKDPNIFIPAIEPDWSGSIPATLVIQPSTGYYRFYEKPFTFIELEQIIQPLINQK